MLCNHKGGAYIKMSGTGKWAHALCSTWALGIPRVRISTVSSYSSSSHIPSTTEQTHNASVFSTSTIDNCAICKETKKGVCIQCAHTGCNIVVHPWCLLSPRANDKRRRYDIEIYIVRERDSNYDKKLIECTVLPDQSDSNDNTQINEGTHSDSSVSRSFVWKFQCTSHEHDSDLQIAHSQGNDPSTSISMIDYRLNDNDNQLLWTDPSLLMTGTMIGEEDTTEASRRVDSALLPSLLHLYDPEVSDSLLALLDSGLDMAVEHYIRTNPNSSNVIDYISNQSLLSKACALGKLSVCKTLVECGANINFQYSDGNTVLHEVCMRRQIKFATFLISNGGNINITNMV